MGEFLVFWSSALYDAQDEDHQGAAYSRVLATWTPNFRESGAPRVLVDRGTDVIDTTMLIQDGLVHRISKQESFSADPECIFHEIGPEIFSDDYRVAATRIGADRYDKLVAPLLFRGRPDDIWYLFVGPYGHRPQG